MAADRAMLWKNRIDRWLWWWVPIGMVADALSIYSAITTKQPTVVQSGVSGAVQPTVTVWGDFALSDAVFITGALTFFTIISILYAGWRTTRTARSWWWMIIASFAAVMLVYGYLRLWLGENWWVYVCMTFFVIGLIIMSALSSNIKGGSASGSSVNETAVLQPIQVLQENSQPDTLSLEELLQQLGGQTYGTAPVDPSFGAQLRNQTPPPDPDDNPLLKLLNQQGQPDEPSGTITPTIDWSNPDFYKDIPPLFRLDDDDKKP